MMHRHGRPLRAVAETLALGNTTGQVARTFDVSPGRVSQLRQEFKTSWQNFQGERPQAGAAVVPT